MKSERGSGEYQETRKKLFEYYIGNLRHEEAPYRWGAAEGLGRLKDEGAIDHLIPLLDDPDWRVRLKTVWALGQIGEERALPFLQQRMRDERDDVREMAKEAIGIINRKRFYTSRD
jgi:HEAT repeat protein